MQKLNQLSKGKENEFSVNTSMVSQMSRAQHITEGHYLKQLSFASDESIDHYFDPAGQQQSSQVEGDRVE